MTKADSSDFDGPRAIRLAHEYGRLAQLPVGHTIVVTARHKASFLDTCRLLVGASNLRYDDEIGGVKSSPCKDVAAAIVAIGEGMKVNKIKGWRYVLVLARENHAFAVLERIYVTNIARDRAVELLDGLAGELRGTEGLPPTPDPKLS